MWVLTCHDDPTLFNNFVPTHVYILVQTQHLTGYTFWLIDLNYESNTTYFYELVYPVLPLFCTLFKDINGLYLWILKFNEQTSNILMDFIFVDITLTYGTCKYLNTKWQVGIMIYVVDINHYSIKEYSFPSLSEYLKKVKIYLKSLDCVLFTLYCTFYVKK